ncbi:MULTISPECIES: ABC transporter ATP-binding protein [unclassified Oceanispirochaeta]|uniref:ABC transporter ATP-binding protein n=1 Tax=unclassified Oceanispirochaeta TaxID=2635722 RepID=UPI000E098A2D|nr:MULTISPECIES: ATP-binding cassette domain-containing protein [unclassified Oceanispirochaeta]MBF9016620.1 ATP-binding cassette domain-containing protein [Oceanispirochaeta sp. M2]NPD73175.1 ATP-binding cassette domain-containing protein [Oceanispirochaeta sp. M1]RDG31271.1 ATP-binding cassette domain-containing protein [Oceanispirochaeta sp. M1]
MNESAVFQDVSYRYIEEDDPVLKNLNFSLQKGSFNILVGPGGSGKSTLCDLFNGRTPHLMGGKLDGKVLIEGKSTVDSEMKDLACKVGYVFQDPESMFATLSVEDEIAFGPENLLFEKERIQKSVDELLDITGIEEYRHNLVWNLSGGQIQKLGLASVLAMEPRIIILDEPTANLDPTATRQVHELILKLKNEGITILLVTRELDDFVSEADQILVLHDGNLIAQGEPYSLLLERGQEIESLGVWLPETVEIGLGLIKAGHSIPRIPITIDEILEELFRLKLVKEGTELSAPERTYLSENGEILIQGEDIKYSYGNDLYALKGISLEIRKGEMLAIVGRNGAGKSTLAKLLIGLNKCREGKLVLFGKKSVKWKVPDLANHISLVFQNPEHQFLTDTVADEIDYSLQSQGIFDSEKLKEERDKILNLLELHKVQEAHPFSLSAGNKRRLGVATMLVGDPKVLIVDEPTYGQDREMTQTLMNIMCDIQKRGVSVVMISHDMRLVEEYADRVAVFSEGLKHFDGIPTELFKTPEILDKANLQQTLLNQILRKLEDRGVIVNGHIPGTSAFLRLLDNCGNNQNSKEQS